jgi:aminopeptidase
MRQGYVFMARMHGEVALVPYDSLISNQKILFYNTLFDENASCYFAHGRERRLGN